MTASTNKANRKTTTAVPVSLETTSLLAVSKQEEISKGFFEHKTPT
jgi:hypothetical protein